MAYRATCKDKSDGLIKEMGMGKPKGIITKYRRILLGLAVIDIALCWTIVFRLGFIAFNVTTVAPVIRIYMYSAVISTAFIIPEIVMPLLIAEYCINLRSLCRD